MACARVELILGDEARANARRPAHQRHPGNSSRRPESDGTIAANRRDRGAMVNHIFRSEWSRCADWAAQLDRVVTAGVDAQHCRRWNWPEGAEEPCETIGMGSKVFSFVAQFVAERQYQDWCTYAVCRVEETEMP